MNFIETVFEWLLAATLRASVLAVVILCLQIALRRWLSPGWRHALWLPMLAVLMLPVLPEARFGLFHQSAGRPAIVTTNSQEPNRSVGTSEQTVSMSASTPNPDAKWNPFALAWLAGANAMLAVGAIGYRRNLKRIRMTATQPDRMLQAVITEAATDAGLKRAPHALISPAVASPAVTGFVRPILLLPAGFPEGFSAAETRLILLHECSHLKRHDLTLNWLICVLHAMHWFNPLLWFAFARMRADREVACDDRVLSIDAMDRRSEYGGALLKLQCATPASALSLGFVGIFERSSEIQSRIRGIATHRPTRFAWNFTGGVIVALLMVFGVTNGQQPGPAPVHKENDLNAAPAEKDSPQIDLSDEIFELDNWKSLYQSYQKNKKRDDGYIAEAYSDTIGDLLAEHWEALPDLDDLVRNNAEFKKFILGHIPGTCDRDVIDHILKNAKTDPSIYHQDLMNEIVSALTKEIQ